MRHATALVLVLLACSCDPRADGPDEPSTRKQVPAPVGAPSPAATERPGVDVTYVGNAGFLFTGPEGKVLIDALYSEPEGFWRVHEPELLTALKEARPPYDDVDLVFVSHNHADHYDPETVAAHLRSNPRAQLVTTNQVAVELAEALSDFDALSERIHAATPKENERIELEVAGFALTLLRITHGPKSISENVGLLFELGGVEILHPGDCVAMAFQLEPYDLPSDEVDLLLVPYWMLAQSVYRPTLREAIAPRTIIAMHLEPRSVVEKHVQTRGGWDGLFQYFQEEYPEAVVIEEPGATVHFP